MGAIPFTLTPQGMAVQNRHPLWPAKEIAIPPSANRMWRHVRGITYPSKEYEGWLSLAGPDLREWFGVIRDFPIRISVTILGGKGFMESGDLDNVIKPIGDALQYRVIRGKEFGAGIIPNDDVRYVSAWDARYLDRAAHAALMDPTGPTTKAALGRLTARAFVMIHPEGN